LKQKAPADHGRTVGILLQMIILRRYEITALKLYTVCCTITANKKLFNTEGGLTRRLLLHYRKKN